MNLPSSVKQGCQLLDQINVSHISFKKDPVMKYKEKTYYLYYHHIFDAIKELLSNLNILKQTEFEFNALYHEGQRIQHEQYNGKWWERVQKSISARLK